MFCQNLACGTEVASSYKICPKCGGRSFGPQRPASAAKDSCVGGSNMTTGAVQHGGGNNTRPAQKYTIPIAIGAAVLLLVGFFGYQQVNAAKQEEIARVERQAEAERQRLAEIERQRLAEIERQRQAEIERQRQAEIEREHRKQVAHRLAEAAKDAIINKQYQGGQNKGVSLNEWSYDAIEDRYLLKVSLSWSGAIMTTNQYAADGIVSVKSDGQGTTWNPTWVNSQLREYQEWRNIVAGTVVIGAIAAGAGQ